MNTEKIQRLLNGPPLLTPIKNNSRIAKLHIAAPDGSEDAMALEFVARHLNEFTYSSGMGWMQNTGSYWKPDEQNKRFDCARRIAREEASREGNDNIRRRIASSATVAGILKLAQTDARIAVCQSDWNARSYELNTPSGIVDLRNGQLREWSKDYLTQITQVAPQFNASYPLWQKFLHQVFLGDLEMIEFIQRFIGYLLTADRSEQKIFFAYGLGANGKSTLWDLVGWMVGTYSHKLPATVLMQSKNERHPTELAQLQGKRLAMSSELDENQFWAESRIKELTGDETLTARYMRQDFFEFKQTQKHIIIGNNKPRLRGGDAALARRFVLINFNAVFAGENLDTGMLEKLKAEAPAILAWAIAGAVKWYKEGLAIPSSVANVSKEYMRDNDDLETWFEERVIRNPNASTKASELYESFSNWAKSRGQQVHSMHLWGERMSAVQGISKYKSNGVRYKGIQLGPTIESSFR